MARVVIADSGAITAALSERDEFHDWASAQLHTLRIPLITCDSVFSECFFLLQREPLALHSLYSLIERGILQLEFSLKPHITTAITMMRKYSNLPMSFADASLVRMSELHGDSVVFTIDTDFRTYRRNGRQMIPLIAPW